ncbi:MAG: DsbA family oxidoreductase [Deltaproteobacteria bacterium]|nr:DsbA family oxidoreductase [Deltaproteobacteria bacterium]
MRIDVWSDIACPWCYLGKHRIEAAAAKLAGRHQLVFHAFELNPGAPRRNDDGLTHRERLAKKFGRAPEQIDQMHERMVGMGREDGIDFHFDRVQGGNTFDAHRLVQLGLERGVQAAVKERMMKAYFSDGESIGDRETLIRLAVEAGLDRNEAADVLATEKYTREVRADETMAQANGISGVPFFVFERRLAVSGAQPVDVLVEAMQQAAAGG